MRKPKITRAYLTRGGPLNEKFRKLPARQKRVAIARDALRWMKAGNITIAAGAYLHANNKPVCDLRRRSVLTTELAGIKALEAANCEVCAKGALFLATVMRTNRATLSEVVYSGASDMCTKVCDTDGVFTEKMFNAIEGIFEDYWRFSRTPVGVRWNKRFPSSYTAATSDEDLTLAELRERERTRDTLRLAAILVNIIQNKGVLVPSRIPTVASVKRYLAKA